MEIVVYNEGENYQQSYTLLPKESKIRESTS